MSQIRITGINEKKLKRSLALKDFRKGISRKRTDNVTQYLLC